MKELVSIRPLVQKAKDQLRAMAASEIRLRENHDEIFRRAWTLGAYLCDLKENVRRGSLLIWLPANLPELGSTDSARTENASRCMRFFNDNPPNSPLIRNEIFVGLRFPKKERLVLESDERINFEPSCITFCYVTPRVSRTRAALTSESKNGRPIVNIGSSLRTSFGDRGRSAVKKWENIAQKSTNAVIVGAASQRLTPTGERSGLLMRAATIRKHFIV